jgi:hypothetical protein
MEVTHRQLPPLPKDDGRSTTTEGITADGSAPTTTATTDGVHATIRELRSEASSVAAPDMTGMIAGKGSKKTGQKGRSIYPDSRLAESWLNEVLEYGIREFGDTESSADKIGVVDGPPASGTEKMRVGRAQLLKAGLSSEEADRIYRALYGEKGVRLSLVHPLFHTKLDSH